MSDWFQRDEPARQAVVKRPNPLDAANELRIKAMEERVKRYPSTETLHKSYIDVL